MIAIVFFSLMFGALVGYAAAERKGLSKVPFVLGGILLGVLSPLLFLVSGVTRGDGPPVRTMPARPIGSSSWLTAALAAIVVVLAIVAVIVTVLR